MIILLTMMLLNVINTAGQVTVGHPDHDYLVDNRAHDYDDIECD